MSDCDRWSSSWTSGRTTGERRFDKVFAVRVGLFHREPERARGMVGRWLAPGGAVFAFFDSPSRRDRAHVQELR